MMVLSYFPVFIIALLAAMIGGILVALIRKWVAVHLLTSHHEVAFPIFLQIGVIYAVLLAFIFSMVLNEIAEAYNTAKTETINILTLAQLAPGFPQEIRQSIDDTLIDYTQTIIHDEWPKMAKRQEDLHVSKILSSLQKIYLNYNPQSLKEEVIYANSLEHLTRLRENRRMRLFTAIEPKLNNQLLMLSILGAIVISVSFFFGMHRLWAQMILTGALIFTIVSILMVISLLGNPFAGKFGIKPTVFENTLIRLHQISNE